MEVLRTVVDAWEFRAGLFAGLVAAVAGAAAGAAWWAAAHRTGRVARPAGLAGLAFAAASLVALDGVDRVPRIPAVLVAAVAALAAGGALSSLPRLSSGGRVALGVAASVPGAWLLAERTGIRGPGWMRSLVLVAAVVVGPLVADFDNRHARLGAGPVLLLVTAGGVYATVPDTEQVLVLLGVAVPIALLGFPAPIAALGRAGAHAAVGTVLWASAFGAVGRPAAMIGVVAAFGLFVAAPIGRCLPGRPFAGLARHGRIVALAILAAVQVVLALYAARVAGPEPRTGRAVAMLAPALLIALAAGWLLAPLASHAEGGRAPSR